MLIGMAAVGTFTVWQEAEFLNTLRIEVQSAKDEGSSIVVLSVESTDVKESELLKCDNLRGVDGVRASGGLSPANSLKISHAPDTSYQTFDVSPGLFEVLGASQRNGIALGSVLAEELGVSEGSPISFGRTTASAGVVSPRGARSQGVDRAVLRVSLPANGYSQCFVEFVSVDRSANLAAAAGYFGAYRIDVLAARHLVSDDSLDLQPGATYADRAIARAWVVFVAVLLVQDIVMVRVRRAEFALRSILGMSAPAQVLMLISERVVITMLSALPATALLLVLGFDGSTVAVSSLSWVRLFSSFILVSTIISVLAVGRRGNEFATLRSSE